MSDSLARENEALKEKLRLYEQQLQMSSDEIETLRNVLQPNDGDGLAASPQKKESDGQTPEGSNMPTQTKSGLSRKESRIPNPLPSLVRSPASSEKGRWELRERGQIEKEKNGGQSEDDDEDFMAGDSRPPPSFQSKPKPVDGVFDGYNASSIVKSSSVVRSSSILPSSTPSKTDSSSYTAPERKGSGVRSGPPKTRGVSRTATPLPGAKNDIRSWSLTKPANSPNKMSQLQEEEAEEEEPEDEVPTELQPQQQSSSTKTSTSTSNLKRTSTPLPQAVSKQSVTQGVKLNTGPAISEENEEDDEEEEDIQMIASQKPVEKPATPGKPPMKPRKERGLIKNVHLSSNNIGKNLPREASLVRHQHEDDDITIRDNTNIREIGKTKEVNKEQMRDAFGERGLYTGSISTQVYLPDGYGLMKYRQGRWYEGDWVLGHWEGYGRFINSIGDIYDGNVKQDKKEGTGTLKFKDGRTFTGRFEDDEMREGKLAFPDGSKYSGMLRNGKRNGFGIYYFSDGSHYEGQWKDDLMHGRGRMEWSDMGWYNGDWENGVQHGIGMEIRPNGTLRHQGAFDRGQPVYDAARISS